MLVDRDGMRQRRYWQAAPGELRYGDDEQYAEQFLDLLRQSVAARLRSAGPVGVMMSGGLDSTSVAAVAAEALARAGSGPLRTYSYVFDELASCDERPYIQAQVAHCGLEATFVPGDDGWPLRDPQTWPVIPDAPWGGLYWRLMERIYRAAQEQGVRVLLGGWFGDHLYSGAEEWLADLIWEGRWLDAAQDFRQAARRFGWRWALWEGGGFAVIKRAWWALPGGRYLWPRRNPKPGWLTAYALNLLRMEQMEPLTSDRWRNRPRGHNTLGLLTSRQASSRYVEERAGMETRSPYRDRRLVEFMLSVPAHQLFRQGRYKHVLRNAMRELSPAVVVNRRVPTSLMPLARRGLAEREWPTAQRLLLSPDAAWPRYVRADWLTNDLPSRLSPQRDGAEALVPWRCVCAELWQNAYGRSDTHGASWRPH